MVLNVRAIVGTLSMNETIRLREMAMMSTMSNILPAGVSASKMML